MRMNKTHSILRFKGGRLNEIVFWVYLPTLTHKTRLKRLILKIVILGIVGKLSFQPGGFFFVDISLKI